MRASIVAFSTLAFLAAASGDGRADGPVAIHSPSELVAGAVTATLGGVSSLAGSILVVSAGAFSDCRFCGGDAQIYLDMGLPLLISGVIATAGGLWLAHEGGRRVRATWSLAPSLAPRSASLSFIATF